jgi:hypothetical protein
MSAIARLELLTAPSAGTSRKSVLTSAVSVEGCRTVRADDLQIRKSVVVWHTIDVVQDEPHAFTAPAFALAAQFTTPRLETGFE